MIAVVTPYYKEDLETIWRAVESVAGQTRACRHVLVADGHPRDEIAGWPVEHVVLPSAHRDGGSFARGVGALHAVSTGAAAVALLDADNWFEADHLETLASLSERTGALVCTSARTLRRQDGTLLHPHDPESDGSRFADTSTFYFDGRAVDLLATWTMIPAEAGQCCDRIVWEAIARKGYRTAHTGRPTANYTTRYVAHYAGLGEAPPPGAMGNEPTDRAIRAWNALPSETRRRIAGV